MNHLCKYTHNNSYKLKTWEVSLLFGVLVALLFGGWLQESQTTLADDVIRLHVIANSDSEADQALKLQVRDSILATLQTIYPENASKEEAERVLNQHLEAISAAGQAVVDGAGYHYPVSATITDCYFPTKTYDGFALPAGEYEALRVTIGDAVGQNWWCVAFPPLCIGATSQTIEEATAAGLFTSDEAKLMTEQSTDYVLKFKSMELLGQFQHYWNTHINP